MTRYVNQVLPRKPFDDKEYDYGPLEVRILISNKMIFFFLIPKINCNKKCDNKEKIKKKNSSHSLH